MVPNVIIFLTTLASTAVFTVLLLTHDPVFVHDPELRYAGGLLVKPSDQRDTFFIKRLGRRSLYLALIILGVLSLFSIQVFS